jgi:Na+-driven multidrug efflux pump
VWGFLALALDAVAIAGQALTGRALGAGDAAGARALTRRMLGWGVGAGAGFGVLLLAGRDCWRRCSAPSRRCSRRSVAC